MKSTFDFWQDHSDQFLVMANLWDRRTAMENPDAIGRKTGDCGDSITIYLAVKKGIVEHLSYELEGCINTNACANVLAVLVEGKPVEFCWNVTPADIIDYLQTLPEDHHHCAELAVGTLYLALADWTKN
ncbi:iron-sulfur cluster assembly scaffold protein [Rhodopseudomonas palustris]|nr:iron-sulfur cluster assembly scaffold protein [Rhodopseudomonas palustris]